MSSPDIAGAYFERGLDLVNRRVFLVGELETDSISNAVKSLYFLETASKTKPVELFINSTGGDIVESLALYDIINTLQCPIHTFAFGSCMSAAPLILAAGNKGDRWVAPNAQFMCHDWGGEVEDRGANLKSMVKWYEYTDDAWINALTPNTSKDKRFWRGFRTKTSDTFFTAQQAIDWGIADHIWSEK